MSTIAQHHSAVAQPRQGVAGSAAGHHEPFQRFDRKLMSWLGADMRLIYGMGVPMVMVIAAMVPMFLSPSYWLVGAVLVFELICLSVVVAKLLAFLDEDGDTDVV